MVLLEGLKTQFALPSLLFKKNRLMGQVLRALDELRIQPVRKNLVAGVFG